MVSTILPVVLVYAELENPSSYSGSNKKMVQYLVLLFPFLTSFLRAVFAFLTPQLKAEILEGAVCKVEYQIYSHRTKTGKYSNLRVAAPTKEGTSKSENTDSKAIYCNK